VPSDKPNGITEDIKFRTTAGIDKDYGGIRNWKFLNVNGSEEPPPHQLTPIEMLFLAVLLDAIETLKHSPKETKPKLVWGATERWLLSSREDYVFAFVPICEHFHWDAKWLRRKIVALVAKARTERRHVIKRHRISVRGQYRRLDQQKMRKC